jgi:hypothetical protein
MDAEVEGVGTAGAGFLEVRLPRMRSSVTAPTVRLLVK